MNANSRESIKRTPSSENLGSGSGLEGWYLDPRNSILPNTELQELELRVKYPDNGKSPFLYPKHRDVENLGKFVS